MAEMKFYRCNHCGNLVAVIEDGGVTPVCCGEKMELLEPGTTDAAKEKHVPVATRNENMIEVNVGEVDHPMTEAHLIEWIALVGEKSIKIHRLSAGDKPSAHFAVCPHASCDCKHTVYAYCNLHGLFSCEI